MNADELKAREEDRRMLVDRQLGTGTSNPPPIPRNPPLPAECRECEFVIERGLNYPPLCELVVRDPKRGPCARDFAKLLRTKRAPADDRCPWQRKLRITDYELP